MPKQTGFSIKQNTPEADKLESRIHDQLKEIWDPTADATVARYLTAMLAKGYDRKKIHGQLKAIVREEISALLLDWLYKHIRIHGAEYQSRNAPASSKTVPKPPPSASKVTPATEDELRLEDLEAQQLEGSDLDEEEDATAGRSDGAGTQAPAGRQDTKQTKAQAPPQPEPQRRASTEAPGSSKSRQPSAPVPHPEPDAAEGPGTSGRPARRHHEPIPIPSFPDSLRSKGNTVPDVGVAGAPQPSAQQHEQEAARVAKDVQAPDEHKQAAAAGGERRARLKSSVVLDWESWQKQRQPGDEKEQPGRSGSGSGRSPERRSNGLAAQAKTNGTKAEPVEAPAAAPASRDRDTLVRSSSGREDQPRTAAGGDAGREGRREGDRGQGSDRHRRHRDDPDLDRQDSRRRSRDLDAPGRRGQERGSDGGGGRRRGASQERHARRSRSRSRSRSPRGRRGARPLVGTANLLRTALRGVDALAGPAAPASRGAGTQREVPAADGAKPSVFARLGAGSGGGVEEAPARAPKAIHGGGGQERTVEPTGQGRKRGLDGPASGGDPDATVLGSPPKAARGGLIDKGAPISLAAATDQRQQQGPQRQGPPSGRPRRESPAAPAASDKDRIASQQTTRRQAAEAADAQAASSGKGAGEAAADVGAPRVQPEPKAAAAAAPADEDPKALELEALRRQMAAMQEQIEKMQAAKTKPEVQPPEVPKAAEPAPASAPTTVPAPRSVLDRLQPADPVRPAQGGRLGPGPLAAGPMAGRGQAGAMGMGMAGAGAARGMVGRGGLSALMLRDDVVLEGGSGSPPRRSPVPGITAVPRPALALVPQSEQQLLAAQLDAEMRSVVVGNVHFLATEDIVRAHFSVAGPVKKVTILRDNFTHQPMGMAVVEMATELATQSAVALHNSPLMEQPIVVTLKAALLLQDMGLAVNPEEVDPLGGQRPVGSALASGPRPAGALPAAAGRLNPAAAPFVPAAAVSGAGPGRPPLGAIGAVPGRVPWGGRGVGGRGPGGRGPGRANVWVRDASAAPATVGAGGSAGAAIGATAVSAAGAAGGLGASG